MRNLLTLIKRDLRSYFSSMIAYVVIMMFLAVVGYFFFSFTLIYARISFHMGADPNLAKNINQMDTILRPLFMNISIVLLLLIPILSMRSIAEEKKQGTIELLFTYPLKNSEIVLGKYLALVVVFIIMFLPTVVYVGLLKLCGAEIPLLSVAIAYLGVFLLGISFLAFGVFASSLTENQTIAAVVSFGGLLLFWLVGWAGDFLDVQWLGITLREVSLLSHYQNFVTGVIDTNDILYYVLFIIFCLYLTQRVVEKRSWR
ncbi:MAG: ABC transporter permease [Candidatus Omnitrophica bacterium]|nr:ABC transporter permease [Candidatus Omnitrophota bacterium]